MEEDYNNVFGLVQDISQNLNKLEFNFLLDKHCDKFKFFFFFLQTISKKAQNFDVLHFLVLSYLDSPFHLTANIHVL